MMWFYADFVTLDFVTNLMKIFFCEWKPNFVFIFSGENYENDFGFLFDAGSLLMS